MNQCSRTGCQDSISYFVIWSNPKLHTDGKIKNWGSCQAHLDYFVSYLTIRGFYLRTEDAV